MIDQLLFDALSDGICITNAEGSPLYVNDAAKRILGSDAVVPQPQICQSLCGRFVGGNADYPAACPLREHGSPIRAVTNRGRCGSNDLRVRCVRLDTVLFDSWEIEKHFTIIEDATAEMALERVKEDWRNMVAHDLCNPLTTIYGSLKLLQELPLGHELQESERNLIAICTKTCNRMNLMLEQFLQVARLESGLMPVKLEDIDLKPLVQDCLDEQAETARGKSIGVEAILPQGLKVRGDRNLLSRVVQNLLSNALKFTPAKGAITVSVVEGDGAVSLCVRDSGAGIAREDLPFIFDRFRQVRQSGEQRIRGNGLGLAFCRQAMSAMGGEIRVESAPRLGTEFILRIPRAA